jgi:hypothetical protein
MHYKAPKDLIRSPPLASLSIPGLPWPSLASLAFPGLPGLPWLHWPSLALPGFPWHPWLSISSLALSGFTPVKPYQRSCKAFLSLVQGLF